MNTTASRPSRAAAGFPAPREAHRFVRVVDDCQEVLAPVDQFEPAGDGRIAQPR